MLLIAHFLSVLDVFLRKYERSHITEHAHYYRFKYDKNITKSVQALLRSYAYDLI